MENKALQALLDELFGKTFIKTYTHTSATYNHDVIDKDARLLVEQIIRKHLLDNHDSEIGVLKAKVFMYEEIIAKSNFAPMVAEKPKE